MRVGVELEDGTDGHFDIDPSSLSVQYRQAVENLDRFVVKDSWPEIGKEREGDIFTKISNLFGLPHILASYDEWTTRMLFKEGDTHIPSIFSRRDEAWIHAITRSNIAVTIGSSPRSLVRHCGRPSHRLYCWRRSFMAWSVSRGTMRLCHSIDNSARDRLHDTVQQGVSAPGCQHRQHTTS